MRNRIPQWPNICDKSSLKVLCNILQIFRNDKQNESFHRLPPWLNYSWIILDSARNLGVILDSDLSMKKHIIRICQTAYFKLKHISSIRRFLTQDAAKTLVTSYILSWLDYCNCLLMGTSNSVIQSLHIVQNFWHPATTTQHLSWKNCTGFPFLNILNIKSLVCVSMP